ncbi:MAG: DUF4388 domain-containing protein [Polyangiaceae bacterium]|nr:DUF4388 domain-containing protein [Polyangiaceae bacterium]
MSGRLEDVPLVDILQFIQLSGRTGTLSLERDDARGELLVHLGKIVGARAPRSLPLGQHLIQRGVLEVAGLERALAVQRTEGRHEPIGAILVRLGLAKKEDVLSAFAEQVAHTIYELLEWRRGEFHFALADHVPPDDLAVSPSELTELNVHTQHLLLEAARLFDERNRDDEAGVSRRGPVSAPLSVPPAPVPSSRRAGAPRPAPGPPRASHSAPEAGSRPTPPAAGSSRPAADPAARARGGRPTERLARSTPVSAPSAGPRLRADSGVRDRPTIRALSTDRSFVEVLVGRAAAQGIHLYPADPADSDPGAEGAHPAASLVDLRGGMVARAMLESLRAAQPTAPLVAVVDGAADIAASYDAGATAVVGPEPDAVVACLAAVTRHQGACAAGQLYAEGLAAGFAKLRRLTREIRTGLMSATVSLSMLNLISDTVERALFLLHRPPELWVHGGFGQADNGARLAERMRGLRVPLGRSGALYECVLDGQARALDWDEAALPAVLGERLGMPRARRCALFPVISGDRVIAVVYADNGDKELPIEEIDFLELAVSQMGMAYENELLRRGEGRVA